ncbi:hypothetical protein [uncultured Gemmiger sp.]|uniref:hypothetical protein n=1 Tax=uncultured Gemmiger sp. TaxID=1623490 RepID=UPI0025E28458|nr:hypothetical protein [uncultured Gemmiger sp.]
MFLNIVDLPAPPRIHCSSAWPIRPEADRGGLWWFCGGLAHKSTTLLLTIFRYYFVFVVDVVDFAGKVPYEKNKKMKVIERFSKRQKSTTIHHRPATVAGLSGISYT